MLDAVLHRFDSCDPQLRRKFALLLLIASVVFMFINTGLYIVGLIDEADLILVTLILSWLAITITCLDVLLTSDVRQQEDERVP